MKNRDNKIASEANRSIQRLTSLPGCSVNSKKAKESKFIKHRAIVFDRQMNENYEIIF